MKPGSSLGPIKSNLGIFSNLPDLHQVLRIGWPTFTEHGVARVHRRASQDLSLQDSSSPNGGHFLRPQFPYVHKRSLGYSFLAPHFCGNQAECRTSPRYAWRNTQDSFCALWMRPFFCLFILLLLVFSLSFLGIWRALSDPAS